MDLNCNKSVFNQLRPDLLQLPVVQTGSPTRSSRSWPGDGVNTTGRLERSAVKHGHVLGEKWTVVVWLLSCCEGK